MAKIISNIVTLLALVALIYLYFTGTFHRIFSGDPVYLQAADECYNIVNASTQGLDDFGLDIANNENFRNAVAIESTCISLDSCATSPFETETCKLTLGRFQREMMEGSLNNHDFDDFGTF
jgi:hypothetical protein